MTLAEKIYQARKKAGLSQEALADALGVTRQAVSKWETGKSVPDTENIRRMALILAVSADYFLGDTAEPPADNPSGAVPLEKPDTLPGLRQSPGLPCGHDRYTAAGRFCTARPDTAHGSDPVCLLCASEPAERFPGPGPLPSQCPGTWRCSGPGAGCGILYRALRSPPAPPLISVQRSHRPLQANSYRISV